RFLPQSKPSLTQSSRPTIYIITNAASLCRSLNGRPGSLLRVGHTPRRDSIRCQGCDRTPSQRDGRAAQRRLSTLQGGRMSVPSSRRNGTKALTRSRQTARFRRAETAAPNAENGTKFRPQRMTNEERRPREHLSRDEVLMLCKAARTNRHGQRDAAAIWITFNHGLRVSELCDLRWSDIAWQERRIMVRRLKASQSGEHPLTEQDKRSLGHCARRDSARLTACSGSPQWASGRCWHGWSYHLNCRRWRSTLTCC